jgi:hypothetical protein
MIDLNEHIGKNVPKSLSDKAKEKCVGSGCWIFIYAQDKLIEML